jgi:hypothetical protein
MQMKNFLRTLLVSLIAGTVSFAQTAQVQVNLFDSPIENIIYGNVINDIAIDLNGVDEEQIELLLDDGSMVKTDFLRYAAIIKNGITKTRLSVYVIEKGKKSFLKSYDLVVERMDAPSLYFGGVLGMPEQINEISKNDLILCTNVFGSFSSENKCTPQIIGIKSMRITIIRKDERVFEYDYFDGKVPPAVVDQFKELNPGDYVVLKVNMVSAGVIWRVKECIYMVK